MSRTPLQKDLVTYFDLATYFLLGNVFLDTNLDATRKIERMIRGAAEQIEAKPSSSRRSLAEVKAEPSLTAHMQGLRNYSSTKRRD
jgi:hypothetical protein